MKKLFTFVGAMFIMAGSALSAQEVCSSAPLQTSASTQDATLEDGEDWIPSISLDSRFSYDRVVSGGPAGFGGDGLYLNIDGKISKNFSYSLYHNLISQPGDDDSVFGNTNWLTLTYHLKNFSFTAGKDALIVGSYEYDAYDIDSYFDMNSIFYNSLSSYQWGVKAMWSNKAETTSIALQVVTSPFSYAPKEDDMYSYNLAWYGSWDCYESIWSANLMEYAPGKYMKMIALGNMFYWGDFSLGLDCVLRGAKVSTVGKDDLMINLAPSYTIADKVRLFGKVGWECSTDDLPYDLWGEYLSLEDKIAANEESVYTMPSYLIGGKDYWYYGAGVEYYPTESVRLHAVWASNNYTSRHSINIGLTWKFVVVKAVKHICCKRNRE
jgi:hypothetical protein